MKRISIISCIIACFSISSMSYAEGLGVALKMGTLGFGIEATKNFTPRINGRLGFNTFTFDESGTESDVDYDIDLNLQSFSAFVDFHPFKGSLRATVGLLINNNELEMTAKPTNTEYNINGIVYQPVDVGTFTGLVDFGGTAPYVGIGWGNAVEKGQRLTFLFDIGVLVQGSTNVELSSTAATATNNAALLADIEAEEKELEDALDGFELFPVISAGFAFQF